MNNSIKYFHLLICLCVLILSCNQKDVLSSEEALLQYKKLKEKHSEISYQNDREAWLELSFQLSQLISKIKNDHEYVLHFYHQSGYSFKLNKLYGESLNNYKQFFNYYNTYESEFSPELKKEYRRKRSFDYRGAAIAYEKLGHLDSAYLEHQKNLKFIKISDSIWKPSAHNDFGMFLAGSKKDTVSALKQFKIAYDISFNNFPDHDLIGSIRDNIGRIYLNKYRLHEAYELFYSNFLFYKKNLNKKSKYELEILKSASKILEILRIQNKNISLNELFCEIEELYRSSFMTQKMDQKIKLEYLRVKMQYLLASKDFKKSYQTLEAIKIMSDSINLSELGSKEKLQVLMNDLTLYGIKSNYRLEKKQKEAAILNQRLVIWLISIVSITFLGVLTFLYYRRKQQIINSRNKQLIAEQDLELSSIRNTQLNLEIESKKRDLSDFAINLTQNQEWAKVLESKLTELKSTKGRARKRLMDEFENDVHKKTTFDTNTKVFFQRLDKLSDSFYSQLNSKFPYLSKTEKRLCSLIRLKIESRNIVTIQNISLGSLNTSRYRLRKKLNLAKDDDLDGYIQNL